MTLSSLDDMLGKLAVMPPARRQTILDTLSQGERETLRLRLAVAEGGALSPVLAELIDACRSGDRPAVLTASAAKALRAAAAAAASHDGIEEALGRLQSARPAKARLFARKAGPR